MSYRQCYYHIVLFVKDEAAAIEEKHKKRLYAEIWEIMKQCGCELFQINGFENEIHLLLDLHPLVALSELIRSVRQISSKWILESNLFPKFEAWEEIYEVSSCSYADRDLMVNMIRNRKFERRSRVLSNSSLPKIYENIEQAARIVA